LLLGNKFAGGFPSAGKLLEHMELSSALNLQWGKVFTKSSDLEMQNRSSKLKMKTS
jgi:hypothetical protein